MGIGGVNDYGSRLTDYRISAKPAVCAEEIKPQETDRQLPEKDTSTAADTSAKVRRTKKPLEDISLTFNANEDFEYLGQDSDIRNLDMEKAISDMKKDQILQQYQYFVGSSKDLFQNTADGIVVPKL